jgi:two-component system LytT family response regulator
MKANKLKTIIIDDAGKARRLLFLMLSEHVPNVEVLGEASNVDDALKLIRMHRPDFILLDIEMPGKSGIELVEFLIAEKTDCQVIFTTAYNDYAIKAFRLAAVDYLLKPINEEELVQAIEKVKQQQNLFEADKRLQVLSQNINSRNPNMLCIPVLNGYEYIPIKEIEYIEASGSYADISLTNGKTKTVSKNLKYFEDILQHFIQFYRVHRSCLINLEHLQMYSKSESGTVILKSGKKVSLSRERKAEFLDMLKKYGSTSTN